MKGWALKVENFRAHPFKRADKWISSRPNPNVQPHIKTGTLVILWTRDFRAHSEMEGENKRDGRVGSRRGKIKGVEGWGRGTL